MTPVIEFYEKLFSNGGVWANFINGQWQDNWGWNLINQPKAGDPGASDFNAKIDRMREVITIRPGKSTRNVGISGAEGFWAGAPYEIDIRDASQPDKGIHHEMGHILLNVTDLSASRHVPIDGSIIRGHIIRQGSTPRANGFSSTGELTVETIQQAIRRDAVPSQWSGRPLAGVSQSQTNIDNIYDVSNGIVQANGGPDLNTPLPWLESITGAENTSTRDWVFNFSAIDEQRSTMASSHRVPGAVGVGNLISDFWIMDRADFLGNANAEILQYVQKVNIQFNAMNWPHIGINTLVKQSGGVIPDFTLNPASVLS